MSSSDGFCIRMDHIQERDILFGRIGCFPTTKQSEEDSRDVSLFGVCWSPLVLFPNYLATLIHNHASDEQNQTIEIFPIGRRSASKMGPSSPSTSLAAQNQHLSFPNVDIPLTTIYSTIESTSNSSAHKLGKIQQIVWASTRPTSSHSPPPVSIHNDTSSQPSFDNSLIIGGSDLGIITLWNPSLELTNTEKELGRYENIVCFRSL